MAEKEPSFVVKWSVFIGIYLTGIFCNVPWVWGNLSVYCSSFFHSHLGYDEGEVAPWLVSLNTIGLCLGVLTCDRIKRKIGLRAVLALGIISFNGGVFASYFTVQHSTWLLDITLGILPGLGMGIIQACQYVLVVRWSVKYKGLAASSVESTCVLGSVVINPIITYYINPDNIESDTDLGRTKVFSQLEIINRVPNSFVVYGLVSIIVNVIGFILTRMNPGDECIIVDWYKLIIRCSGKDSSLTEESPLKQSSNGISCNGNTAKNVYGVKSDDLNGNDYTPDVDNDVISHAANQEPNQGNIDAEKGKSDVSNESHHLGPKEILKTRVFYILYITMAVADFTFIALTTYYKAFGLVHIQDDHFLTSVGTVMCVGIAVISYAGGFAVDRFGTNRSVVWFVGLMALFSTLFYVSATIDKWFYMVISVAYGAFDFGVVCILSSVCLSLWGHTHLSTNYGLVLSACVITNTTLPPVIELVLLSYGWFTLFTILAVTIFCDLLLCVFLIPNV